MASKKPKRRTKRSAKHHASSSELNVAPSNESGQNRPIPIRSRAAFERFLTEPRPVIIDFWAPWCAPCRAMGPMFEKLAQDFQGQAIFLKVDTEEVPEVAAGFGIRSIPTVIVMIEGEVIDSQIGLASEGALASMIRRAVDRSQGVTLATKIKRLFSREPAENVALDR